MVLLSALAWKDMNFKAMKFHVEVRTDKINDVYFPLGKLLSLSDIDDCLAAALMNSDLCENDTNTQCVNLDGSYECVCAFGFERVNGTCLCKSRTTLNLAEAYRSSLYCTKKSMQCLKLSLHLHHKY